MVFFPTASLGHKRYSSILSCSFFCLQDLCLAEKIFQIAKYVTLAQCHGSYLWPVENCLVDAVVTGNFLSEKGQKGPINWQGLKQTEVIWRVKWPWKYQPFHTCISCSTAFWPRDNSSVIPTGPAEIDHILNTFIICNQYIFLPYQGFQIAMVPTYSMKGPFRGHMSLKSSRKYSNYYLIHAYVLQLWKNGLSIMTLLKIPILLLEQKKEDNCFQYLLLQKSDVLNSGKQLSWSGSLPTTCRRIASKLFCLQLPISEMLFHCTFSIAI